MRTASLVAGLCAAALVLMPVTISSPVAAAAGSPHEPPSPSVPMPFGKLTCAPENGIRFCPGGLHGGTDLRIPSFDGVPLDADLSLPAIGKGPFPLLVLLHGLGGTKTAFEVSADDGHVDNVTMADHGFAVLNYSARGWGTSCGTAASRANTPGCANGWIQLADQRFEIRDTQYLAGLLVDEGLVKPGIAVSGVSYGGGQSLELSMLKNRMRLPNGKLVPFVSPKLHVPMSVAAAFAIWPWEDLVTALVPNGHLITAPGVQSPAKADLSPAGVEKESWQTLLYGVTKGANLAPSGVDPNADLTPWHDEESAGEPYLAKERAPLSLLQTDKSAIGIPMAPGGPAPTAIQAGWTDTLFPVSEDLHFANEVAAAHAKTPLLMMFDDVGHGWAQGKTADIALTDRQGIAFLDAEMLTHTKPLTGVIALPQSCPITAPFGPVTRGKSLAALARGHLRLSGSKAQTVTSAGGDPTVSAKLNPAYKSPLCDPMPATPESGTALYERSFGKSAVTLLGAPTVTARITVKGLYPELVGRLWDVSPNGTRQIVALGVYRPTVQQSHLTKVNASAGQSINFQLDPNDYTFPAGDHAAFELVGSTAPLFRPSNGTFSVSVSHLTLTLPTH